MVEFTISFNYKNKQYKAGVLKSAGPTKTKFNVRPIDPFLVREFGHQINILWKQGRYTIQNHILKDCSNYIYTIVKAIHDHEKIKSEIEIVRFSGRDQPA